MNSWRRLPGEIWLGLALSGLAFPFLAGLVPIVRFPREVIEIEVHPDHVVVDGLYVYRNPLPVPALQGFSVPLPVDEAHPEPIGVSARRVAPREEEIALRHIFGAYRFDQRFPPRGEVHVRVRYRQQASRRDARYTLTTTQPWGRPLEAGEYRLIPRGVRITGSNYPLLPEGDALTFRRRGFMPEEDWTFSWEERE
jgi:hypothetical protein